MSWRAILAGLVLAAWAGAAAAESYAVYGGEQYFKLEWEAGQRKGRPNVRGYLLNDYGFPAASVRLRVESLDGGGQVTGTTIGYVAGQVTPGMRAYFEVPVPAAPAYRVSVLSWEWLQFGGGGDLR